jgi:membrane protein CcdC involved in cytochrome C biogenesis
MAFPGTALIGPVLGTLAVLAWRVHEGRSAVTVRKIVIPPLGMATGFSMFFMEGFRVPWLWGIAAYLIGAVGLAYPLLRTSRLEKRGEVVMMQRSNAFFSVILALAAVRLFARGYLDSVITVKQSAALLYLVAFGMISRWRFAMLMEYRKVTQSSL